MKPQPQIDTTGEEDPNTPKGPAFSPPAQHRPYWIDHAGERVVTSAVWAGTSPESRQRVFDTTLTYVANCYSQRHAQAIASGLIFRNSGVDHLLAELKSQLDSGHWVHK